MKKDEILKIGKGLIISRLFIRDTPSNYNKFIVVYGYGTLTQSLRFDYRKVSKSFDGTTSHIIFKDGDE